MDKLLNLNTVIYSCCSCRSIHSSLEHLLFVEENSSKSFCSEKCIEDFYKPLLLYFENNEVELRKKLALVDETVIFGVSEEEVLKRLIDLPDEVWCLKNELGEELYSYIKYFNKAYLIVLCTSFKNEPSYIFNTVKTTDVRLVNEFRIGKIKIAENKILHGLGEIIERKKSEILATILSLHTEADIPLESYIDYDKFSEETLNEADEIYEAKDKYGDSIVTYIKSFNDINTSIFYIVVCLKADSISLKNIELENLGIDEVEDLKNSQMTIFPVISFPTRSAEVYREFKQGKLLSGHISN